MARARPIVFAPLYFVWLVFLAVGCGPDRAGPSDGANASPGSSERGASEVAVLTVRPGLETSDAFETYLEPVVDVPVAARSDGVINQVRVKDGDRVSAGTVLGRLEDEEQRLEVEYTDALSAQAQAELERAERGAEGAVVSRQSLDAARAKARATKVDLELAKLAYEKRTLRTPVPGIVWQVRAEPHRLAKSGDILFRVTDPSRLRAELFLPASFKGRLKLGDAVELVPASGASESPITGRVRAISPIVDPATGRLRVVVEAPGGGRSLAGITARASFADMKGSAGCVLPHGAYIERKEDRLHVWRIENGVARRVAVDLGSARPDGYEVLSGLSAGDLVCAAGGALPVEGASVRPRLAAGSTP